MWLNKLKILLLHLTVFLKFIQPSVEVFQVRIDEPITTATDLLLAGVAFYAFLRIRKQEDGGMIRKYFSYYFLTLGLAALFGGVLGHAFFYKLSQPWKLVSWIPTLLSVGILSHLLVVLSRNIVKPYYARTLAWINFLILGIALVHTLNTLAFSAVTYYTIFGMVVVVGSLSYLIYQKTGSRGAMQLTLAVCVGILSAVVFMYEVGLGPWFNHNDISHVILSVSALTIYKGAVLIMEAPASLL
jgi:hypothetical protein